MSLRVDGDMPDPLIVVLWGLLAIAVITAVGRWCRAHPGRLPDDRDDAPVTSR
jgi:hypothetical protein